MIVKGIVVIAFALFITHPLYAALSLEELALDKIRPRVIHIQITDPTPNSEHGRTYTGNFKKGELMVEIEFSEPMDRTEDLAVDYDPDKSDDYNDLLEKNDSSKVYIMLGTRKVPIHEGEWVTKFFWVGALDADEIISYYSDNGKLQAVVMGALDEAGNALYEQRSTIYYLDIRPRFSEVKIFPNPINTHDFIVSCKSTEDLQSPPQVFVGSKVVNMKQITGVKFIGSLVLEREYVGINELSITGTDLQGNAGSWPQTDEDFMQSPARFMVSEIDHSGGTLTSADGKCNVSIRDSSMSGAHLFIVQAEEAVQGSEYEDCIHEGCLFSVYPGIDLYRKAVVKASCSDAGNDVGLFSLDSGEPRFISRATYDGNGYSAETGRLGKLAFIRDSKAPVITDSKTVASGFINLEINDSLSGVDWGSLVVSVDDRLVEPEIDEESGLIVMRRPSGCGACEIEMTVTDMMGNRAVLRKQVKVLAPAVLNHFRLFPQPAFSELNVDYSFDQAPMTVQFKLFDSSGRRVLDRSFTGSMEDVLSIGMNRAGRDFASGAYLYKFRARFADGSSYEKQGRVAVLNEEGR